MKKLNKRKIITGVVVLAVIILLVFIPKPVYVEFSEPKQPNELIEMFQNISITNIKVHAVGVNYSGGGIVENLDDIEPLLKDMESDNGELVGITNIEFSTSGTDLIYLMTHKKDHDIAAIYVFNVILGRIEDQIERLVFR
ncbi:hypothetical protein [Sinanaerobacter chloroacetimidivorans]|jgi:hypothetical protein|uniref:Uncharacterized protein n=1 Tax=Sinanaerobacter chloroacetimidivorans TaxID=2818044 RepID=A0A8J7W3G4_9FIRM|nr:hypothetical protein [Sinanaerobacter chloroacetimidivorans]MBR0600192.1 hypothetical protein [Sinanaerobacter chloroacetimidivorans]